MASKALRPLPVLHAELSEETRVRQRYADLIVREEARDMVRTRAAITRSIRETLHRQGYVEVETPMLQLVHGGATARPFETHMNAFDQEMTLRIALELYLKRAVVGGIDRVYEMGRIFRNEGVDSTHSPEFTMLEVLPGLGRPVVMADLIKEIILDVADAAGWAASCRPKPARSTSTASGPGWRSTRGCPTSWARRSPPTPRSPSCWRWPPSTRSRSTPAGTPRSSSWSCSASSSSRRCSSRPSSATTRRPPSRWPARTARTAG